MMLQWICHYYYVLQVRMCVYSACMCMYVAITLFLHVTLILMQYCMHRQVF